MTPEEQAQLRTQQARALGALVAVPDVVLEFAEKMAPHGVELALVGGSVRDALLGRPVADIDLTTNVRPQEFMALAKTLTPHVWDVGIQFGTVGVRYEDVVMEVTTYRADVYEADSRRPAVVFGDSLEEDLRRRDFTMNALAVRLPSRELVDISQGVRDLQQGLLRTPRTPEESFAEDPLRMLRAARFMSQLEVRPDPAVTAAATAMAQRLQIVSAERIRDEFNKLLLGKNPRLGLEFLTQTGLAQQFLPELPAMAQTVDEHLRHKDVYEHSLTVLEQAIALEQSHEPTSEPDLILRLAALLHDIGKPKTRRFEAGGVVTFHHHDVVGAKLARKRLKALRYSKEQIAAVSHLVELHLRFHGYGDGQWTDSAVRRYVRDGGEQLVRLHKLTRADCTTRNQRKAARLRRAYDDLEQRIEALAEQEELAALRPELNGQQIMEILQVSPGPEVGRAYQFLLELRLERGIIGEAAARAELEQWWQDVGGAV